MNTKKVIFSPEAERAVKKLSKQDQKVVKEALQKFRNGDGNQKIEKIKANPAFFRLRTAHLRIIYYPLSPERVVLLLIGDRKDIYRKIPALDAKLDTAIRKLRLAK